MDRQYTESAYLESIAKFASNVATMSGLTENAALARIVVTDTYRDIKKNHEHFHDADLLNAAEKVCRELGMKIREHIDISQPSETLKFKLFCFESYRKAKNMSEAEAAGVFVQNGVGTYLETAYSVIKTDNYTNVVLDIDIYINAREVAYRPEL